MKCVLVHHAEAVGPDVDPQRPLSARGRDQAERVAQDLRDAGVVPAAIWHSGKLRARQTAETCLRVCNPFAEFRMIRGLRSEDPPDWVRDELATESRDILLVGHMPHIRRLAVLLAPGADVPLHGATTFERQEDGTWRALEDAPRD